MVETRKRSYDESNGPGRSNSRKKTKSYPPPRKPARKSSTEVDDSDGSDPETSTTKKGKAPLPTVDEDEEMQDVDKGAGAGEEEDAEGEASEEDDGSGSESSGPITTKPPWDGPVKLRMLPGLTMKPLGGNGAIREGYDLYLDYMGQRAADKIGRPRPVKRIRIELDFSTFALQLGRPIKSHFKRCDRCCAISGACVHDGKRSCNLCTECGAKCTFSDNVGGSVITLKSRKNVKVKTPKVMATSEAHARRAARIANAAWEAGKLPTPAVWKTQGKKPIALGEADDNVQDDARKTKRLFRLPHEIQADIDGIMAVLRDIAAESAAADAATKEADTAEARAEAAREKELEEVIQRHMALAAGFPITAPGEVAASTGQITAPIQAGAASADGIIASGHVATAAADVNQTLGVLNQTVGTLSMQMASLVQDNAALRAENQQLRMQIAQLGGTVDQQALDEAAQGTYLEVAALPSPQLLLPAPAPIQPTEAGPCENLFEPLPELDLDDDFLNSLNLPQGYGNLDLSDLGEFGSQPGFQAGNTARQATPPFGDPAPDPFNPQPRQRVDLIDLVPGRGLAPPFKLPPQTSTASAGIQAQAQIAQPTSGSQRIANLRQITDDYASTTNQAAAPQESTPAFSAFAQRMMALGAEFQVSASPSRAEAAQSVAAGIGIDPTGERRRLSQIRKTEAERQIEKGNGRKAAEKRKAAEMRKSDSSKRAEEKKKADAAKRLSRQLSQISETGKSHQARQKQVESIKVRPVQQEEDRAAASARDDALFMPPPPPPTASQQAGASQAAQAPQADPHDVEMGDVEPDFLWMLESLEQDQRSADHGLSYEDPENFQLARTAKNNNTGEYNSEDPELNTMYDKFGVNRRNP
ncbi:hypothetical protein BDV12DRAFT_195881 [Aspergillus spectabilis]